MISSTGISFILILSLLAADPPDPNKKDLDAMQGDWMGEQYIRDGFTFPDDDAQAMFRTVKGNSYSVFRFRKKLASGTFTLDATKSPKQIDLTPDSAKGVVLHGIYKLEKDRLTICFAAPKQKRPTEFTSKPDSGITLNVWLREQK